MTTRLFAVQLTRFNETAGDDTLIIDTDENEEGCKLLSFNCTLSRTETDNSAPYLQEARKPDTGFKGIRYTIQCLFLEDNSGLQKLIDWYTESPDVINSSGENIRRNGRFSLTYFRAATLTLDSNPLNPPTAATGRFRGLDVISKEESGLRLVHMDYTDDVAYGIQRATIILDHSGEASEIGS